MYMSNESILVIIIVGLIAGWLAGQIAWGTGFGIIGDLLVGIVGAFIGNWLLRLIAKAFDNIAIRQVDVQSGSTIFETHAH